MSAKLAIALMIALSGQVLYHLSLKNVPAGAHPIVSLVVFYAVAIVCSLPLLLLFPVERGIRAELAQLNVHVVLVGAAIVLIELGFVLAYRAGGELSTTFVITSVAVTASLLVLGMMLFDEHLTWSRVAGLGFAVVGIVLLARR